MSKHTPGPWRIKSNGRLTFVVALGHKIAEVPPGHTHTTANVRLIAAAPLLLNVVEALLLFHCSPPWTSEKAEEWEWLLHPLLGDEPFEVTTKSLCDAARAAIAKARGEK